MLAQLCAFLEQPLKSSCQSALSNPYVQMAALGVGVLSALSFFSYRYGRGHASSITDIDDDFQYIETRVLRKLPIQSLLKAYFSDKRDKTLHQKYQIAIGALSGEKTMTQKQVIQEVLRKLGLPTDGTYPDELNETDKNAQQIVAWCLTRSSSPVSAAKSSF